MKARYCQALTALAVGLVASAPLTPAAAQVTRSADPNAPRLVVQVFRSSEKNAGVQAADAIRTRISQDVSLKQLWVLPKTDITNNLEASGFSTTEALNLSDARQLAQLLRGDMFLTGNVVKDSAGGYRVDANYILTRDASLVQPLVSVHVNKPDQAAGPVSKEFQAVLKSFQSERNCVNAARDQKYADAIAAAKKGIADYPNSTLARICWANVLISQKAPADSILALTNEILKIDPRSKPALTAAYDALKSSGKTQEATDMLLRLVGADPTNSRLVEQVVNDLAGSGQASKAIPFVDQLVRDNQGDPSFVGLQMRVHLAAKDYKTGLAAGEELMKLDTAAATPELFTRLGIAAIVDSQPQKAAELFARGIAKFPTNADLMSTYITALQQAGQTQQALDVITKAIASGAKIPGLRTTQATIYLKLNQPDKALESLQAAQTAGDSASAVALAALGIGQSLQKAAIATKSIPELQKAITVMDFAIKTSSTPEGLLLRTASNLQLGGYYLNDASELAKAKPLNKSAVCAAVKGAQDAFGAAQVDLPQAGRANPQAAQTLATQLTQYSGYAEQYAKALCGAK